MITEEIKELESMKSQAMSDYQSIWSQYEKLKEQGDNFGAERALAVASPLLTSAEDNDRRIQNKMTELQSMIADGRFLDQLGEGEKKPETDTEKNSKLSQGLSLLLGQPVNMNDEIGWAERRNLALLSDTEKDGYLASKFQPENIRDVKVMGQKIRFVNTGNGFFPVDRPDFTAKDIMDFAGEIAPMAGSVVGGVKGAALGPVGAAGGAAVGYTAGGTLQDQIVRAALGVDRPFSESLGQRSLEGLAGIPFDLGTPLVVGPIVRKVQKARIGEVPKRTQEIMEAASRLEGRLGKIPTDVLTGTAEKQRKMLRAAEMFPNSALGQDVRVFSQRLERFKDANLPSQELPNVLYRDAVNAAKADKEAFVAMVETYDPKVATILRRGANKDIQQMIDRPRMHEESAAEYLRATLEGGAAEAKKRKDAIYTPFYEKANQAVSVDPDELAKVLENKLYEGASRPSSVQSMIDALRQRKSNSNEIVKMQKQIDSGTLQPNVKERFQNEIARLKNISGPLNASQLDEQYRMIRGDAPVGAMAGKGLGQDEIVLGQIERTFKGYRDKAYADSGLYEDWVKAKSEMEALTDYTQTGLADILRTGKGEKLTAKQTLDAFFRSPEDTRRALAAIKRDDPQNYESFLRSAQESYLNRIGLNGKKIGSGDRFDFDEATVMELFGPENHHRGTAMVNKLNLLKDHFKQNKINPSKITLDDVKALEKVLDKSSIKELVETIGAREADIQKAEEAGRNILLDIAMKGHGEAIARGELPEALFNARPDQVRKVFSKFGPKDQRSMREDFFEYLVNRYPADPDATVARRMLWDGDQLLKDVAANPKLRQNMEIALGEDYAKDLLAASRLTPVTKSVPDGQTFRVTGVVTEKGVRAFAPVQSIIGTLGNAWTAAMYRSGQLSPAFMKRLANREFTDDQIRREIAKSISASVLTSAGLQAATGWGRYSPETSYRLGLVFGGPSKKALEYQQEFGYGTKRSP